MTHTPGPWFYDPARTCILSATAKDWDGDPSPVIYTIGAMCGDDTAADLALIVAAPAMLAALQRIIGAVANGEHMDNIADSGALVAAIAAIAAATGEPIPSAPTVGD